MANINNIPIRFKIGFFFLIFALILLSLLFIFLIPKVQKKQYENALLETEKKVLLSKYQITLVVNYFKEYGNLKQNEAKIEIKNVIDQIKLKSKLDKKYNNTKFNTDIKNITNKFICKADLVDKNSTLSFNNTFTDKTFDFTNIPYNTWERKLNKKNFCPQVSYQLYKTILRNKELRLSCSSYFKKSNINNDLEKEVKQIVQKGFALSENIHFGKIYLIWINNQLKDKNLFKSLDSIDNKDNQNYCISKISNYIFPKTGELTIKDLLEVKDTQRLEHKIEEKNTLTWVSKIYQEENKNFLFVLSAFENDFKNDINDSIINIIYISIFALILSILFGYSLFRRWFNNIEKLSATARQICLGKLNLRSNIKGNDDIGILGVAFDTMLDKLEDNIKTLDSKVANSTLELTNSLKTKELLLKEIHHRVKNNLSLTINFIKLQKHKIDDKKIISALTSIENRVYTMALLHTKLYESKNLDLIDFKIYTRQLIEDIKLTFEEDINIPIIIDIDNIYLNIDQAMPCGLIINEAIVNAFKYAFIKRSNTHFLKISFKKTAYTYNLQIKDNGIGLKEEFDIEKSDSLGLNLIKSISTTQLNGNFQLIKEQGTHLIIKFPL